MKTDYLEHQSYPTDLIFSGWWLGFWFASLSLIANHSELTTAVDVVVHRANLVDKTTGLWPAVFAIETYPTIKRYCAEKGYRGTFIYDTYSLLHCRVDISANIKSRWVVERIFA